MRENRTYSLSGGRRLALGRPSAPPPTRHRIKAYQSDWVDFRSALYPSVSYQTYMANEAGLLHDVGLDWKVRARNIVSVYLHSNVFVWGLYKKALPP